MAGDELPHTSIEVPFESLVRKADPTFYRDRRNELFYQFSRRNFYADQAQQGAYADEESDFGYGTGTFGTGTYSTPRDER